MSEALKEEAANRSRICQTKSWKSFSSFAANFCPRKSCRYRPVVETERAIMSLTVKQLELWTATLNLIAHL